MKYNLTSAKRTDLPDIFQLVHGLAKYEESEDQVTATLAMYHKAFDQKLFFSDVAKIDQKIIGFTLYYYSFSTWKGKMMYLEDFFVEEEFRKLGVGNALFERFITASKEKGCKLTKWQVLDWNELAIKFYEKRKARIQKDWFNCLIDL